MKKSEIAPIIHTFLLLGLVLVFDLSALQYIGLLLVYSVTYFLLVLMKALAIGFHQGITETIGYRRAFRAVYMMVYFEVASRLPRARRQ